MFVSLLKKLFGRNASARSSETTTNNQTTSSPLDTKRPVTSDAQETSALEHKNNQAREEALAEIQNSQIELRRADVLFYDYLLSTPSEGFVSKLEQELLVNINQVLSYSSKVVSSLPKLPHSVNKLMGLLESDEFDLSAFCSVVEKDPTVATQLIAVANSAHYNPSGSDVSDIRRAFALLGSQGVKEHVLLAYVKDLVNVPKVYYKTFGEKIWVHSDETAVICRELAKQRGLDPDTGFLIGLVHDIGKIFIFKLIVEAFRKSHPDEQLGSMVIKKLLHQKSLQLSILITEQWQMPSVIVNAIRDLAQQGNNPNTTPYGSLLIDANFINEWQLLIAAGLVSNDEFELAKLRKPLSADARNYIAQSA
ncbi:MAG: HDOD domain-containing protein [Paraglaciecola sp.]|uniref:HDOD domain-containing protein n=1 Tax=Paraglaciecola sp. TaxID=1920173 RepID=UPI00329A7401